jgi:hypothetical protein
MHDRTGLQNLQAFALTLADFGSSDFERENL